ncbi:putative transcriptional regulator SLK2 isoform X1 [Canna indica]|uniref:Transcriptional regulator SLK2 isoform X1 n=1 Tax=Canna indica TaxID=4628 RepID=A0AAQ3Q3Z7_9LILI|nr:putative transcriptional regulator SLK2 isoform X1 [Canna indica]
MTGSRCSGLGPVSYDMNCGLLNTTANSSGPSVGASSLVTDANSAITARQMRRSTSINNESYMRPPASPMSFSSNNISGSSVIDGTIIQQNPHQEQAYKQDAPSATSEMMTQELDNSVNSLKKAKLDFKKDDLMQQQMVQQLLQRPETVLQGHQNLQLQAIFQQQRLAQFQQHQQHIMQSFPMMQRLPFTFQQQQQLRQHMQQASEVVSPIKNQTDSVIGSRRLMQYLYHQRHRPAANSILYWRKFVTEYFAPPAKKRWCLSLYDNIGNHALGVFPQSAKQDAWQCDLCESKSGKGFEATFEVLPRLFHIKFDQGVINENLFLGVPRECRLPSGIIVLEYEKAVHESVYEHLRVVREGKLRIIFTPELKILFWDFCARHHEEFLPRRVLAPQVNQLLQVAQKYQTSANESGSAGVPNQDLQASCNMFITTGCQLARNLELQSLNELGFSKRYVRYLQMSEVVNSLKDLIDFSQEHTIGPIESLKNYASQVTAKLQQQKSHGLNQPMLVQNLSTDQSMLNRIMGNHLAVNNNVHNNLVARHVLNTSQPSDLALDNYHLKNHDILQQEQLGPKERQPIQVQDPLAQSSTSVTSISGQPQQPQLDGCLRLQNNLHPSQLNQHLHQHAIQQMLQQVINNNRGAPQLCVNGANVNGLITTDVNGSRLTGIPVSRMNPKSVGSITEFLNMHHDMSNSSMGMVASRNNSLKSVSSNPVVNSSNLNSRMDLSQSTDLPELDCIANEFENDVFGSDLSDLGYDWKV